MRRVLGCYLRRRVAGQMLGTLAVLAGLMQLLELLDVTTDILDRDLGFSGIVRYALLRLPAELVVALPLAVLLGAMSTFFAMARSHEITALRSAGVSMSRLLRHLLPVPLLFAVLQLALTQGIVPLTESNLKVWWDDHAPPERTAPDPRWVHTSAGPVSIERTSPNGRHLQGLRIYERGADGTLTLRTHARDARWVGSEWSLEGIEDLRVAPEGAARAKEAQRAWKANLRPEDVMQLDVAQPHLSSMMLVDVIVGERVRGQPLSYYQTVLLRSFTAPLGLFIMLLLALAPATTLERGGGGGRLLLALALGLGFLLCDGIMSALGTSGKLPAVWAAVAAPALFTLIGLVQLHSYDRI